MSIEQNLEVAQRFLENLGSGAPAEQIARMFSPELEWNIPGAPGVLPWVGRKSGRAAVEDFVRDSSRLMERVKMEVHDVLASKDRAVIVGELASRIIATGKIIETPYTIVLTIAEGEITHLLMLENSFAVAEATRP